MMTYVDSRAGLTHFLGKGSQGAVRAAHRVSALQQETGDGGKTASPDANEMDVCHNSFALGSVPAAGDVSGSLTLDVHHEHKYEGDDDSKVDARFAEQLRRHIEHHLVNRLQQRRVRGFRDDFWERIVRNVPIEQNRPDDEIPIQRAHDGAEERIL